MDGPFMLHAAANGKSLLAALNGTAGVQSARAGGWGSRCPTSNAPTHGAALLADLARTRARGYGLPDRKAELDVTAVVVRGTDGAAVGALSVVGPTLRPLATRIDELTGALSETGRRLATVRPARARQEKVP
jgi:IclR family acetate operon transcriptional repressor